MAAKLKSNTVITFLKKTKVSRTGVHAKTKTSKLKNSKNYRKSYKRQGR